MIEMGGERGSGRSVLMMTADLEKNLHKPNKSCQFSRLQDNAFSQIEVLRWPYFFFLFSLLLILHTRHILAHFATRGKSSSLLQNQTSVICLHTFKSSNSSISNNSIYHESFVCTQLKCQTVLFDP